MDAKRRLYKGTTDDGAVFYCMAMHEHDAAKSMLIVAEAHPIPVDGSAVDEGSLQPSEIVMRVEPASAR